MKIEKINENKIRCFLTRDDLENRHIKLSEIAYGTEKARSLFRDMMEQASSQFGFEADNIPLMVEAIPMSNECIILDITKVADPEELDTRFSKFAPPSEEDQDGLFGGLSSELLEGADGLLDFLKKDMLGLPSEPAGSTETGLKTDADAVQESGAEESPAIQTRIYRFGSLDEATDAGKVTAPVNPGRSTLYKKPGTSQYYLVLSSEGTDPLTFSRLCNILAEYGEKVKQEAASEAYYREHYEVIIHDQALQKLALI